MVQELSKNVPAAQQDIPEQLFCISVHVYSVMRRSVVTFRPNKSWLKLFPDIRYGVEREGERLQCFSQPTSLIARRTLQAEEEEEASVP